jgi:hypothetical protein
MLNSSKVPVLQWSESTPDPAPCWQPWLGWRVSSNWTLESTLELDLIKDATAGARHPERGDGYAAALVNFGDMTNAVLWTDESVTAT